MATAVATAAAAAAAAAAAEAVAAGTKDEPDVKRSNMTSCAPWVATVHSTASIL